MASGITATPQVHGASLVVSLIADIATLSVDGVTIGSRVACIENSEKYELTKSDAALDPGVVEAVAGYSDARWILVTGGGGSGTVESVTGDGVNDTDPDNPVIDLTDVIAATMLQDDSVTTDAIDDLAVTAAKIGPSAAVFCAALKIPGPWITVAVPSDTQNVDIGSLDISVAGGYQFFVDFATPDNSQTLTVQPNAVATNQETRTVVAQGGSTITSTTGTSFVISDSSTDAGVGGSFTLIKGVGTDVIYNTATGRNGTRYWIQGRWTGGANMTSVRIASTDADGINAGSIIRYRALNMI